MSQFALEPDRHRAFIHWESKGKLGDGPEVSLYGINFLVFDSYGMIQTVIAFRQPLSMERKKYLKMSP